ncbi:1-phosphofructokinase family hexose kinase [Dactylosporangium sp. CA-052675]|uniref:1-phosphofructokinase family hexose kinase n=1 Tax=Dactylosporangium sp. CA-052675 TaxID=3239927 RepID=UPI003D8D465A
MSGSVMVFAPAPVLTVTIERHAGRQDLHVHAGGQGVWQARMLASLGCEVRLCVGVGGEIGAVLADVLGRLDPAITLHAVTLGAGSGWYVHDRREGERAEIAEEPGPPLRRHDLDELANMALEQGLRADVSVLSGPADPAIVDADTYRRLAADLGANGGTVVADLSGDLLAAVVAGGPAFVKVSHEELLADGRAGDDGVPALVDAARKLRAEGAGAVLVSRAGEPAVAVYGEHRVAAVHVPKLQVVDPRGAGDSMSAGVAAVLAGGGDLEEAIRTGAAAGALNVTRHGLGSGPGSTVRELLTRTYLEPLEAS